jgi:hypothetical protein
MLRDALRIVHRGLCSEHITDHAPDDTRSGADDARSGADDERSGDLGCYVALRHLLR